MLGTTLAMTASFVAAPSALAATSGSHDLTKLLDGTGPTQQPAPAAPAKHSPTAPTHRGAHRAAHLGDQSQPSTATGSAQRRAQSIDTSRPHPDRPAQPERPARAQVELYQGTPTYNVSTTRTTSAVRTPAAVPTACQVHGPVSGTWSTADCPSGYEVTADAYVPKGKTLTIEPGTTVFVDPATDATPAAGDGNVSNLVDLVVNGTLDVKGTAASPVVITSTYAERDSSQVPAPGSWGYLFFNHTGGQRGTGSINHLRLVYGQGLAADRTAPALRNSTISYVGGGVNAAITPALRTNEGIDYEDAPGGTVKFTNVTFDGGNASGVRVGSDFDHADFAGHTYAAKPFGFRLTGSRLTGGTADTVFVADRLAGADAAGNRPGVALDVHRNRITNSSDYYNGLEVQSSTNDGGTVDGSSAITGVVRDNVVTGALYSYGVYLYSDVAQGNATGRSVCGGVTSCVAVSFLRNRINSDLEPVASYATIEAGHGAAWVSAPVGKRTKSSVQPGGTYQSNNDTGFDFEATNKGDGPAAVSAPIVRTTINSYSDSVYAQAEAYQGAATTAVTGSQSAWKSYDGDTLHTDTTGSEYDLPPAGKSGNGTSKIALDHMSLDAYSDNVASYTESNRRTGVNKQLISNSVLNSSDGYNVDNDAYGSNDAGSGAGTSETQVVASKLTSYDGNVYNYAGGSNHRSPGAATVSVRGSKLSSYGDYAINNESYSAQNDGSHGKATTSTEVRSSKVMSYYDTVYTEASSNYGPAESSPAVHGSQLTSADGDAIYNEVYSAESGGSGSAVGNPVIKHSTTDVYDYLVNNDVYSYYGDGDATANPVIQAVTGSTASDYALYNDAEGTDQDGSTGDATANPKILGSDLTTGSDLVDNYADAPYGAASGSPVVNNVTGQFGSYGIYNIITAGQYDGAGDATGSPVISNSDLQSYEYAVYNEVYSHGGAAAGSPVIADSKVVTLDDAVIDNDVQSSLDRNTGAAVGSPVIGGSEVQSYYPLMNNSVSGGRGKATGSPSLVDSTVSISDDEGVSNSVESDSAGATSGHTATANPRIVNSSLNVLYYALSNSAYGDYGPAVANPVVKGSRVVEAYSSDYYDTIDNYAGASYYGGSGQATASPTVTDSVVKSTSDAFWNEAESNVGKAVANPAVDGSRLISQYASGLDNYAYGANSSGSGASNARPTVTGSKLVSVDSDYAALYNEASGNGPAAAEPTVTGSRLTGTSDSDGYALDNEAYSGGDNPATANPTVGSSRLTAYEEALYNYADGGSGNSPADASFTVTGSRLVSTDTTAVEASAYGNGTAASTVAPVVEGVVLVAPDGDGLDLYADPNGSGPAHVGGTVDSTSMTVEGDGIYGYADAAGGQPGVFDTRVSSSDLTATDGAGIGGYWYSNGSPVLMAPVLVDSTVTAPDSYAIYLEPNGYAGTGGALKAAPVVKRSTLDSYYGIYLQPQDNVGSAQDGRSVVGGSVTGSSITSTDWYGIYGFADCEYCNDGAAEAIKVKNTTINAYNEGVWAEAYVSANSAAPAQLGGYVKSTKHSSVVSDDGYAVAGQVQTYSGDIKDTFKVSGLHVDGHLGGIYRQATSDASVGGDIVDHGSANGNIVEVSGADGSSSVYGAGGIADLASTAGSIERAGTVSGNTITSIPGRYGIAVASDAPTVAMDLTVAHNRVSDISGDDQTGDGIAVLSQSAPATGGVVIDHNTVNRTAGIGIGVANVVSAVTSNIVTNAGLQPSFTSTEDGLVVEMAPGQGVVKCNVLAQDTVAADYVGNVADPVTHNNAFVSRGSTVRNAVDLRSDSGATDASHNYWGGKPIVKGAGIDTSSRLGSFPTCAKSAGA